MARKAIVFGMRVRYYNRSRLDPELEEECGAEYVSFDELLAQSDVLSLNLPLNARDVPLSNSAHPTPVL
ncbi:Uu.00g060910.m01.CDS01 [Anthostomella pinea]|uniref:Uu.00g060910.m01.CDS01 n=1 Tax=Anthostomella pinea TaxID=933095 RepID=A0AAI8VSE0_9PEZI|nr:Uu.00g060910.m01.CDS01 [Anthostomella pinea]